MRKTITVIIPFFQRTQGVLARSLASVFSQILPSDTHVTIVIADDESPVSLKAELSQISIPANFRVNILERPNGGPGAARNTALDSISVCDSEFVAFLDSDDIWGPTHLAEGLDALGDSADFYFCDHKRWHNSKTWFSESKSIPHWLEGGDNMVTALPGTSDVFEFRAGCALLAFLVDYMAQTSTVIYRFAMLDQLRFDSTLRHAGEDNMFWLDLAAKARAVRFSRRPNVATGEGVNMYFSSLVSWDHPDAARRIGYNLLFLARATRRFGNVPRARKLMGDRYWNCQKEFAWVWARRIVKTRSIDMAPLFGVLRERPSLYFTLPAALLASGFNRPNGMK